jgi:hypothetical protein
MRRLLVFLSLVFAMAAADRKPTRASLIAAEKQFDAMVQRQWVDDPYVLLGTTRAIYVDGFGVVMTAEINLSTGPTVSPFNPTISKESIAKHRDKKLQRLPQLKELIKNGTISARTWFPELAATDNLVVGVTVLKYQWEDATGMPSQLIGITQQRKDAAVKLQEN